MALGTPVAAAAAYSAASGTTVAPAYPTGILTSDVVLLFVGQKPTAVGGGTVTTPTGWTLRDELTNAGGYTAQGADSGNTNLRVYSWNSPVAGQTGTLSVTIGGNDVTWAFMVRIPKGAGAAEFGSADGQRTTTPTSPMSIALTNEATATDFRTGDRAIWAMCIPTDVTTPSQFSAQSITATGATFGTATELNEPDSTTGNDIGGYSAWAAVTAGSSTTAPTVTTTVGGTLTNVRGPVVLLRVREAAVTHATDGVLTGQLGSVSGTAQRNSPHATTGTLTGQGSTVVGAADRQSGTVTHVTTGALTGPGSTVAGTSARFRAFATSGALTGQGSSIVGAAQHKALHSTTGALSGPGSALAGAAARTRQHATDGTLTGQGSVLTGLAARTRQHATAGVLTTDGAIIVGSAARVGAPIVHDTSGVLTGPGAIIVGDANLIDPPRGGGGPGNAINIQRRKPRGWANERAALEQSLLEPDEQRQDDLSRIAQTLADSGQAQAQRIARKLADYTGELTQVESLQRELAKLEAAQRSRELWAERNHDVQAAAAELSDILRDDEDVAGALVALHEHETRLMLGVLGITVK